VVKSQLIEPVNLIPHNRGELTRARAIVDSHSGREFQASFRLPNGFQLTEAEVGSGSTDVKAGVELHLSDSRAHFSTLHMNQDGVTR
jgi:hypothetical protein